MALTANMHLVASLPNALTVEVDQTGNPLIDGLLARPLRMRDGELRGARRTWSRHRVERGHCRSLRDPARDTDSGGQLLRHGVLVGVWGKSRLSTTQGSPMRRCRTPPGTGSSPCETVTRREWDGMGRPAVSRSVSSAVSGPASTLLRPIIALTDTSRHRCALEFSASEARLRSASGRDAVCHADGNGLPGPSISGDQAATGAPGSGRRDRACAHAPITATSRFPAAGGAKRIHSTVNGP